MCWKMCENASNALPPCVAKCSNNRPYPSLWRSAFLSFNEECCCYRCCYGVSSNASEDQNPDGKRAWATTPRDYWLAGQYIQYMSYMCKRCYVLSRAMYTGRVRIIMCDSCTDPKGQLLSQRFDVKLELALTGACDPTLVLLGNSFPCTCRKILASIPRAGEMPCLSSRNSMVLRRSLRSTCSGTIDRSCGLGELKVAERTSTLPNCLCVMLVIGYFKSDPNLRMCRA